MSAADDRHYRAAFYPAVDQRQALDDRQSQYYVPIYNRPELQTYDIVREFADAIDFSSGESVHLLSGFKGSGKTSELLRLIEVVRASGRPAVYMDIETFANTEVPLDLAAFPVMLAAGFASGAGLSAAAKASVVERLYGFLRRVKVEPTVSVDVAVASLDLNLGLRDDNSLMQQISKAVRDNRRTFREELHAFFADVTRTVSPDKAPLFVVDSIDHYRGHAEQQFSAVRTSVETAFSELADELCLPGLHVIYTVPLYVSSPLGVRHEVLNIKVALPSGEPYEPGIAAMRDVLAKRAPDGDSERLFGGQADHVIRQSGGLFRDLLRLTGQLIQSARVLPATEADLARAEMVLRNDFEGSLSAEKVDILRRIRETNQLTPKNNEWSDAMDLMTSGAILKYPNAVRAWYGVHPLLVPLL